MVDAALNATTVSFEFGFAGAAGAYAAAELAHGLATAGEAGQRVLKLSELTWSWPSRVRA